MALQTSASPCLCLLSLFWLQVKDRAERFSDALMLDYANGADGVPEPILGTISVSGGAGSETPVWYRCWSETNRHQLSWGYEDQVFIQRKALNFFMMR